MSKMRVSISIILISAVLYDIVNARRKCNITSGFDIDKLDGTWHYVAGISPRKSRIQCGYITLKRGSTYNLHGYKVGFYDGDLRNMTITAYFRDNIMDLRTVHNRMYVDVIYMWMRTCNGETEFALEKPRRKIYWIFSRGTTVTPVFLKYYRLKGRKEGLRLRRANDTYCASDRVKHSDEKENNFDVNCTISP